MVARTRGKLDVPVGTAACRVMTLPKMQVGSLHWRNSTTSVASVVNGAAADYARAREGQLADTDTVFCGKLC